MSIVLQSFSCCGKHQNQIQIHFDYLGQEWAAAVVAAVAAAVGYFHCFGPQYQLLQFGGDDLHRLAGHLADPLVENHCCSCSEPLSLPRQQTNGYSEVVHCTHQH